MISQDNNSSETRLHVRAKLPLTDKSFKHACPQASTASGNARWHPMVLKPRKNESYPTWHSLFNVTVLTGLLHGLLFTAFTITRWGHFCWGKNRRISNRTFDHWDETVWVSYSFRSRGSHWVSFMSLFRKRVDQHHPPLSGREDPYLDSIILRFGAKDTTPNLSSLHTDQPLQMCHLLKPGFKSERFDAAAMPKCPSRKVGMGQTYPAQTLLSAPPFFQNVLDTDREKNIYAR